MKTILILYPKDFTCYKKFCRKVSNITSKTNQFTLICPQDFNNFISAYLKENGTPEKLVIKKDWDVKDITHAIIFDDGEEFSEETKRIQDQEIPLRLIKITITRVVNIKTETKYNKSKSTAYYEYIGRGSYWGNPYSMYEDGADRDEVIRKYKYDFDNNLFPNKDISKIHKLAGKRLGCFCKPKKCHGDILASYLNSCDDGK